MHTAPGLTALCHDEKLAMISTQSACETMSSILVAEDDELLRTAIVDALESEGFKLSVAKDGTDAIALCELGRYDLLVLDWNMPGASGIEVSRCYRKQGKGEPILFLTSRSDIIDKEMAYGVGADDYLTKPFILKEMLLRVKALLKRPVTSLETGIRLGEYTFEPTSGVLSNGQKQVKFRRREADLLLFFVKHPGQVLNQDALISSVWGAEYDGSDVAVRSCLAKVRKILSELGLDGCIETVHGFGYQFNPPKS